MKWILSPEAVAKTVLAWRRILIPLQNVLYDYTQDRVVFSASECILDVVRAGDFIVVLLSASLAVLSREMYPIAQHGLYKPAFRLQASADSVVVDFGDHVELLSVPGLSSIFDVPKPHNARFLTTNGLLFYFYADTGVIEVDAAAYHVLLYHNIESPVGCYYFTSDSVCVVLERYMLVLSNAKQLLQAEFFGSVVAACSDDLTLYLAFADGRVQQLENARTIKKEFSRYQKLLNANGIGSNTLITSINAGDGTLQVNFANFAYFVRDAQIIAFSGFSNRLELALTQFPRTQLEGEISTALGQFYCIGGGQSFALFEANVLVRSLYFKRAVFLIKLLRIVGELVLIGTTAKGLLICFVQKPMDEAFEEALPGKKIQQIEQFQGNMLVARSDAELLFYDVMERRIIRTDGELSVCVAWHPRYLFSFDSQGALSYYFMHGDDIYCSPKKAFLRVKDVDIDENGLFMAVLMAEKVIVFRICDFQQVSEFTAFGCGSVRFSGHEIAIFGEAGGRFVSCENIGEIMRGFECEIKKAGKTAEQMWAAVSLINWTNQSNLTSSQ